MTTLTLTEARLVAEQIEQSKAVDPLYWPWVIRELCKMVEGEHPRKGAMTADELLEEVRAHARCAVEERLQPVEECTERVFARIEAEVERLHAAIRAAVAEERHRAAELCKREDVWHGTGEYEDLHPKFKNEIWPHPGYRFAAAIYREPK